MTAAEARSETNRFLNMSRLEQIMTYDIYPAIREQVDKGRGSSIAFVVYSWRWTKEGGAEDGTSWVFEIKVALEGAGYRVEMEPHVSRGEINELMRVSW
jgi:hypothetical protein